MNKLFSILVFFILAIFISCSNNNSELSLLKVTELGSAKLSDSALVKVLHKQTNTKINIKYSLSEDSALKQLRNRNIDLAIIPNNTIVDENDYEVRTIIPLLPRILLILTHNISNNIEYDLKGLLENNNVIYEDLSRIDSLFFQKLFISFGIDKNKVQGFLSNRIDFNRWEDSSFVFIGLTHLHNPLMKKLIDNGAKFYSLDDVSNINSGSNAEGFILDFPSANTFILPKSFYKGEPKQPVLTVSILDILVCHRDLDYNIVNSITESLIENKPQLINYDNIYSMLDTEYSLEYYSFPLHKGTEIYLNREKPPIWSRYASIIWPIVSMIAIFIGLFASLRNRMKQRQKHRIETYYGELLKIRKSALKDKSNTKGLLKSLDKIRSEAFDALSEDKLVANESFAIFLSLYSEIKNDLIAISP